MLRNPLLRQASNVGKKCSTSVTQKSFRLFHSLPRSHKLPIFYLFANGSRFTRIHFEKGDKSINFTINWRIRSGAPSSNYKFTKWIRVIINECILYTMEFMLQGGALVSSKHTATLCASNPLRKLAEPLCARQRDRNLNSK